ncbi:unnamed protein product, partial [Mesorhabditis spiculigera]
MLHHRRAARYLNAIIAFSFLGILFIYFGRSSPGIDSSTQWSRPQLDPSLFRIAEEPLNLPLEKAPNFLTNTTQSQEAKASVRLNLSDWYITAKSLPLTGAEVVKSVNFLNENFQVLNLDKFGPLEEVQYVIVVQVHDRAAYLKILIDTLRVATGIEKSLIIFSHDIALAEINQLIRGIEFARVLQIFYPYNTQLFPHVFPGQHPDDCAEKWRAKGAASKCRNWQTPDKYGNYRVSKLTQIKHHWWWKMNYVFDGVVAPYKLDEKWVVLLEEDHYASPDFLHVLTYMAENRESLCPQCDILCLGIYIKNYQSAALQPEHLGAAPWYSSKYNMGMTIRKQLWDQMKNCSEIFCAWDDYNWDWSMLQVSVQCLPARWKVLYTKAPRVLHIGDCGVHTHRCNTKKGVEMAADYVQRHAEKFFPTTMRVSDVSRRMLKPSKANGGWGDPRDHTLCRRNTSPLLSGTKHDVVLDELLNSTIHLD